MPEAKYLREPGYINDLLFVFTLMHNRQAWAKRFLNSDKGSEDIAFYTGVLDRFAASSDELLLFFYLMENRQAFITRFYLNAYAGLFDTKYNFGFLCEKLSDIGLLRKNIIQFYFNVGEDGVKEINGLPLIQISIKVNQLQLPDRLKQLLTMFFIDPEYFSKKLIAELIAAERVLDRYYKENDDGITEIIDSLDFERINQALRRQENLQLNRQEPGCRYFSCSIIAVNLLEQIGSGQNRTLLIGKNGLEFSQYLSKRNSDADLEKLGKVLSEPKRIEILKKLAERGEMYTSEIAHMLHISVTAAYYHLELMSEVKMLLSRSEGRTVFFRLNEGYFEAVSREILKFAQKKNPQSIDKAGEESLFDGLAS